MLNIENLEDLAKAATPGPWEATRQTDDECNHIGYFIEAGDKAISDDGTAPSNADALFIAAANPAAVLELIALARAPTTTVAAERERAARLALQWSNARHPDHGGNALRGYAQALRDGIQVCEDTSRDYHWSKAPAAPAALPGEWAEAERICNLPGVHEAIQGFADDQTGDAGTMIVREVMRASGRDVALLQALKDIAEACNCCGSRSDLAEMAQEALDNHAAMAAQQGETGGAA